MSDRFLLFFSSRISSDFLSMGTSSLVKFTILSSIILSISAQSKNKFLVTSKSEFPVCVCVYFFSLEFQSSVLSPGIQGNFLLNAGHCGGKTVGTLEDILFSQRRMHLSFRRQLERGQVILTQSEIQIFEDEFSAF